MPRHRVTRNKVRFGCRPQSNFRLRRSAIRKHRFRTFQSINFLSNRNDQRWRNTDEHEIERSDLGQRGNKINRISSKRNFEMLGVGITPKNLESLRFERHSDGCTDQPGSNDAYLQNGIPRESLIGILQDSMKMGRETWSKPIASSVQKLCVGRLEVTAEPKNLGIGPDDQRSQSRIVVLRLIPKMGRETRSKPNASSVQKLCGGRFEVTAELKHLGIGSDDQRLQSRIVVLRQIPKFGTTDPV